MKWIPYSTAEIQWLFRSRRSNRLNLLSYVIFIISVSIVLAWLIGALWLALLDKRTELEKTSEIFNWVYGNPQNVFKNFDESFSASQRDLFAISAWDDKKGVLVKAVDLKNNTTENVKMERVRMFNMPEITAYSSFVTYSKKPTAGFRDSLTPTERQVFMNFTEFIKSRYEYEKNPDKNHIEQSLAK